MSNKGVACSIDGCPAPPGIQPDAACLICDAAVHDKCFQQFVWTLPVYPSDCGIKIFCCAMCCHWHNDDNIIATSVQARRGELSEMNKTSLKKVACDKNVHVTFCEDGQSWDMAKDVIIWKLLEVESVNPAQGAAL